jgi:hypothetical protein
LTEAVAYWTFGLILGGAIAAGIGKSLVAERGRKIVPSLAAAGVILGVALGWAINAYVAYVRASATLHP